MCPIASSRQGLEKPESLYPPLYSTDICWSPTCSLQQLLIPMTRKPEARSFPSLLVLSVLLNFPPHSHSPFPATPLHLPASFISCLIYTRHPRLFFNLKALAWELEYCTQIHSYSNRMAQGVSTASRLSWGKYFFQVLHVSPPQTDPSPPIHGQLSQLRWTEVYHFLDKAEIVVLTSQLHVHQGQYYSTLTCLWTSVYILCPLLVHSQRLPYFPPPAIHWDFKV